MDYGTGAIFGCPAHDQRDLDFARKYGLPVIDVFAAPAERPGRGRGLSCRRRASRSTTCARSPATAVMTGEEAVAAAIAGCEAQRHRRGRDQVPPARLGPQPPALLGLPDPGHPLRGLRHRAERRENLPVRLPDDATFDRPGNPLERHPTWAQVACPACGGAGAARDRHDGHLRRLVLVLRPLHRAARRRRRPAGPTPTTG